jgi:HemY protein
MQAAQKLVAGNPDHVESHVLLARTALEADLPGEARHHLDVLRARGLNQRRVWLLRAELEETERGNTEEGRQAHHEALRRAAEAEADPGWRCFTCGTGRADWAPACPVCLTAGGVRWGAGTPVVTLPRVE